MFGPTSRLLRSTGAFLGFAFAVSGCQSVTQQKTAWSFPPFRESIEGRPVEAVENQALPPLPAQYERWANQQNSPGTQNFAGTGDMKSNPIGSRVGLPLQDASIVRSSTFPATTATKASAGVDTGFMNPAAMSVPLSAEVPIDRSGLAAPKPIFTVAERNVGTTATSVIHDTSGSGAVPIEPPPSLPVPMDPKTTQQIVKRIVGASDELIRTSSVQHAVDDEPILPSFARPMRNHGQQRESNEKPIAASAIPDAARGIAALTGPARPPLETIPAEAAEIVMDRSKAASSQPSISIPRAAICKSVDGRGRFVALPEHARVPGAPMIIYWEMDKLARAKPGQSVAFTALVELVSTERDEILASARETVRDSGPEPAEGDFAALRWRIPSELAPGDYRIRISVTEESTRQTAKSQLEFPVGRPPVASRFLLP